MVVRWREGEEWRGDEVSVSEIVKPDSSFRQHGLSEEICPGRQLGMLIVEYNKRARPKARA